MNCVAEFAMIVFATTVLYHMHLYLVQVGRSEYNVQTSVPLDEVATEGGGGGEGVRKTPCENPCNDMKIKKKRTGPNSYTRRRKQEL